MRLALVQNFVGSEKDDNVQKACNMIREAALNGAKLIALPECFNSPYGTQHFKNYAEAIPKGPTTSRLSQVAKECNVYVVGGSIPESLDGNYYNTCCVFNPDGEIVATFRKMHLCDINVPGIGNFKESSILSPGNEFATFCIGSCKVGLGICYDLRFPEVTQSYAHKDCHLVLFPSVFNITTGVIHWKPLLVARALDNQMYVAGIAPARSNDASYAAWSHSCAVGPWGNIISEAGIKEEIIYVDVDVSEVYAMRKAMPLKDQKRKDLYSSGGPNAD